MQEQQQMTEEQSNEWMREQFQKANKHLAEHGVLYESVFVDECRYLAPFVAVWKIKASDGKKFWAITGDVPSDFVGLDAAKTAREVMKHFSLQWQLKAEKLIQAGNTDETGKKYAGLLINSAENLYRLSENKELWQ